MSYVPERGDLVWIAFNPQAGHEQTGRRPALVLSPEKYNQRVKLAIMCPITTKIKNYPFEVRLPENMKTTGVILADQVKSLDWEAREIAFIEKAPTSVVEEVLKKLNTLLKP